MESLLLQVALSVLGAFGGAFFGARRFVREKTWEAKHKAYQDIVESVNKVSYWAEQHLANLFDLPSTTSERFAELGREFEHAREQLSRYAVVGGLLISEAATREVESLRNEIEAAAYYYEEQRVDGNERDVFARYCELIQRAVATHLPEIIRLAKEDLHGRSLRSLRSLPQSLGRWRQKKIPAEPGS